MSGIAAAVVVGGYLSSEAQKSSAEKAASAQTKASQAGIAAQRAEFNRMQQLLQPYTTAGSPAIQEQMALLGFAPVYQQPQITQPQMMQPQQRTPEWGGGGVGMGGALGAVMTRAGSQPQQMQPQQMQPQQMQQQAGAPQMSYEGGEAGLAAQRAAIERISSSPELQAMMMQGEEAMLQRASATGGLRGGNIQGALAQYRPAMLNQAIQQRYANLAGMTALGQQSAAGVGAAGMQTGQAVAGQLGQIGAAQAGSALAQGQAQQQMYNTVPQALGMYYGMSGQSGF